MTIFVKIIEPRFWEDNHVATINEGACDHNGENDQKTSQPFDSEVAAENIIVCSKCKAWRYADDFLDDGWRNEVIIESPCPSNVTKELVLR